MKVLCFDISSGGLASAIFDEQLVASDVVEIPWDIEIQPDGAATLDPARLLEALKTRAEIPHVDAISFSGFMHSSLILDAHDRPTSPIFTWMDRRGSDAVDVIRREFGSSFHQRTGCRFHPMFPIFKLAWLHFASPLRFVSAKSFIIERLTGLWVEDHGSASATGLYNVLNGDWDPDLTHRVQIKSGTLPQLVQRDDIVGKVKKDSAREYRLPEGIPVVAGSGDGFLANLGSGCDDPTRMAVTLGTSSSVRQLLSSAVLDEAAGTFCYRAHDNGFLLGCASSNGGNVLDWARSVFGMLPETPVSRTDLPTFIPLLNGERSPEWDPLRTARWIGVRARHSAEDLARAVLDGVVFNLAHYVEILEHASGIRAAQVILSGNGFLNPLAAQTLASVLDATVLQPRRQGLASLRGAAICGLRALGIDSSAGVEHLVADSETIRPRDVSQTQERYQRYREFR